jgi:hypothetical protein
MTSVEAAAGDALEVAPVPSCAAFARTALRRIPALIKLGDQGFVNKKTSKKSTYFSPIVTSLCLR